MKGLNQVNLIGTLGRDPDVRYMPSGSAVANIAIATNETWKDKETGEKKERTDWHNLTFFGKLAEIAQQYLNKGDRIHVRGKLRTDMYEKEGQKHYATKIHVEDMLMLSPPKNGQTGAEQAQRPAAQRAEPAQAAMADDGFDDDIPF